MAVTAPTTTTEKPADAAKTIGPVTTSATAGAGIAGAATVLIVWGLNASGVDVPAEVAQAITVLLAAAGALVAGWLAPSQADAVARAVAANAPSTEEVAGAVHGVLAAQQTTEDTGTAYTPSHAAQAAAAPSVDEVEEVTVSSTPPDTTAEADEFPETVIAQPTA